MNGIAARHAFTTVGDVSGAHIHQVMIESHFEPILDQKVVETSLHLASYALRLNPVGVAALGSQLDTMAFGDPLISYSADSKCKLRRAFNRDASCEAPHRETDELQLHFPTPAHVSRQTNVAMGSGETYARLVQSLTKTVHTITQAQVLQLADFLVACGTAVSPAVDSPTAPVAIVSGRSGAGKTYLGHSLLRAVAGAVSVSKSDPNCAWRPHITCRYLSIAAIAAHNVHAAENSTSWLADALMSAIDSCCHALPFVRAGPWATSGGDDEASPAVPVFSQPSTPLCLVVDDCSLLTQPESFPARLALVRFKAWLAALSGRPSNSLCPCPPVAIVLLDDREDAELHHAAFVGCSVRLGRVPSRDCRRELLRATLKELDERDESRVAQLAEELLARTLPEHMARDLVNIAGAAVHPRTLNTMPAPSVGHGVTALEDLVGIDAEVDVLRRLLIEPLRQCTSVTFDALGVYVPKGALITGPSGTGKTALLAALARAMDGIATTGGDETKVHTILVNAHSLIQKEVGESEKNVARLFAQARACAPCVLFVDGLEAVAAPRARQRSEVDQASDRVLSSLLIEMDGIVRSGVSAPVVVIATAPSVDLLDPAVRRSGRLDVHVTTHAPSTVDVASLMFRLLSRITSRGSTECSDDELRPLCGVIAASVTAAKGGQAPSVTSHANVIGLCRDIALRAARRLDSTEPTSVQVAIMTELTDLAASLTSASPAPR